MTYTNPGLCHLYQDDIEGGREGFCDRLCQKRHLHVALTIPDATECNNLKKVMDVVALCISVLAL